MRNQVHRFGAIKPRSPHKPRIRKILTNAAGALTMLLGIIALGVAWADALDDFYKGRAVDLYIGYSVGGAYDLYARVIGRHLGAHLPGNPTLVPKNLEGAGSLRLANYLYRVAPRDGSPARSGAANLSAPGRSRGSRARHAHRESAFS